ncbi:MAG: isopentenyl phosphate kinase [Candidatus Hermodarchaeota archaeon]
MNKKIIVLKLGGSLLTDKSIPFKLRDNILNSVVKEIKECIDLGLIEELVVIHGVGSYGHPPVLKYNLHKGFKSPSQLIPLSETQYIVNNYRNMIAKSFLDLDIPINLMHASSIIVGESMKITDYYFKALRGYLSLGMVPLIGGDMMYDKNMGFSVCGGDQLAVIISREIGAEYLIFATDVLGIYDKDPKDNPNALLLKEININEIEQLLERKEVVNKIDASGGMRGKLISLISAKDLIKKGLKVSVISMIKRDTLKNYLQEQDINVTKIVF